jgi:hypothetical protein
MQIAMARRVFAQFLIIENVFLADNADSKLNNDDQCD